MKIIYCDGSSLGNPGRAGFGVVAIDTNKKLLWEFGEAVKIATNNQMELAACIYALKIILKSNTQNPDDLNQKKYELRLDSKYVIQGATEWHKGWIKNGWKNSQKKDVANKEMWQELIGLTYELSSNKIEVKWTHVYGHTGETWNERCDEIARGLAAGEEVTLRKAAAY